MLESRDGNLFISSAKDKNITLKILGDGHLNVNEINLLEVANAVWRHYFPQELNSGTVDFLVNDVIRLVFFFLGGKRDTFNRKMENGIPERSGIEFTTIDAGCGGSRGFGEKNSHDERIWRRK